MSSDKPAFQKVKITSPMLEAAARAFLEFDSDELRDARPEDIVRPILRAALQQPLRLPEVA